MTTYVAIVTLRFSFTFQDFTQMIVHHVATIALLYFSWIMNFVRIGTLVLIVHDVADVPMAVGDFVFYQLPLILNALLHVA